MEKKQRQLVCQVKDYNNIVADYDQYVQHAETYEEAIAALEEGDWHLVLLSEHLKDNSSERIARYIAANPERRSKYLYFLNVNPDKLAILREILEPLYPRN